MEDTVHQEEDTAPAGQAADTASAAAQAAGVQEAEVSAAAQAVGVQEAAALAAGMQETVIMQAAQAAEERRRRGIEGW